MSDLPWCTPVCPGFSDIAVFLPPFSGSFASASRPRAPSCSFGRDADEMLKRHGPTGDSFSCFLWDLACQFVSRPARLQQLCVCHVLVECSRAARERMPHQPQTKQGTHMIDGLYLVRLPPHPHPHPVKQFCPSLSIVREFTEVNADHEQGSPKSELFFQTLTKGANRASPAFSKSAADPSTFGRSPLRFTRVRNEYS